jgi:hypothetical protein
MGACEHGHESVVKLLLESDVVTVEHINAAGNVSFSSVNCREGVAFKVASSESSGSSKVDG